MKDEDRRAALEILAERLGREDIPGVIADDSLIKDYLGTAYVTDDEEHWGEAERETRRLLNVYFSAPGGSRPPGRGEGEGTHAPPAEVAVEPSENATKRAQAFSELASALAENHPDIKEFRRKHLRDRLLTDDKARTFLDRHDGPDGPSWSMRELRKLAELLAYT